MLSRQFLSWADRASAGERADAAGALARACLYADIDRVERGEIERAMTCLLDDPSPLVRRSLAEALAGAVEAPHHLVSALANDQAGVAAIVLARSPVLTDAELIDAAAVGESPAQCAIASRPGLSAAVAGALAEVGGLDCVLVLCRNRAATLADVSIHRILERFGRDGTIREALGARPDLGVALRHELVVVTGEALRRFVTTCGWIAPERARRIVGDAGDRAVLALDHAEAVEAGDIGRMRFAGYLRRTGHLTPALVLRALMSGRLALFEALLAELSGQPLGRVSGLARRPDGLGFAALVRSSGLAEGLLPALRAALEDLRPSGGEAAPVLRREVVARVLARCDRDGDSPVAGLMALLRRFETEAARDESRLAAMETRPDAPLLAIAVEGHRRIEPHFDTQRHLAVAA